MGPVSLMFWNSPILEQGSYMIYFEVAVEFKKAPPKPKPPIHLEIRDFTDYTWKKIVDVGINLDE